MNPILQLLGIAKKAGKLVLGTDAVVKNLSKQSTKMIFVAKDASCATIDKLDKKAFFYQIPVVVQYTTEELSQALGCPQIKVIALNDSGFAKTIQKEIERGDFS